MAIMCERNRLCDKNKYREDGRRENEMRGFLVINFRENLWSTFCWCKNPNAKFCIIEQIEIKYLVALVSEIKKCHIRQNSDVCKEHMFCFCAPWNSPFGTHTRTHKLLLWVYFKWHYNQWVLLNIIQIINACYFYAKKTVYDFLYRVNVEGPIRYNRKKTFFT